MILLVLLHIIDHSQCLADKKLFHNFTNFQDLIEIIPLIAGDRPNTSTLLRLENCPKTISKQYTGFPIKTTTMMSSKSKIKFVIQILSIR